MALVQFTFQKRHAIQKREHYFFEIDEWRREDGTQLLLTHFRVSKFSPAIMKAILSDWRVFRECVSAPLFAVPVDETGAEVDVEKWEHFVSLFGFKPTNQTILWGGKPRPIFLHTKEFNGHVISIPEQHQQH